MGMTEDIETLAIKVTRLKTEYEQYFANLKKREPLRLREDVEKIIMRYSNVPLTNTALKFKFSSVVSKYIAYKQHWIRVLREIAEGTYHRKPEGVMVRVREISETPPEKPAADILEGIYRNYIDTKLLCGESTKGISFEKFKKALEKEKQRVMEARGAKDVEIKVSIKDGKAAISLIPRT